MKRLLPNLMRNKRNNIFNKQDDDWYYGNILEKCDETKKWKSNAAEEIEWQVTAQIGIGKLVYILTKDHWYWDYPTNSNLYGNYRIWYRRDTSIIPPFAPCIHDDTLNYYYLESLDIIHTIENLGGGCPDTLKFILICK